MYRTIQDLERLINFASQHKGETAVTVGGGLLGLEAAKAMTDLKDFGNVKLIDRNKWVLARQLDADAGTLVTRKIRELGLDVLHQKRVAIVNTDSDNNVTGITFEDGEKIQCCCICFAVSILHNALAYTGCLWIVSRSVSSREMNWVFPLGSNLPREEDLLLMKGLSRYFGSLRHF